MLKELMLAALISVESGGNDQAIGDHGKAIGPLQIHAELVADVNRFTGTSYKHYQMTNRVISVYMCEKYFEHYATALRLGHEATPEDLARIWNGGPDGYKHQSTLKYWKRVQAQLNSQSTVSK